MARAAAFPPKRGPPALSLATVDYTKEKGSKEKEKRKGFIKRKGLRTEFIQTKVKYS